MVGPGLWTNSASTDPSPWAVLSIASSTDGNDIGLDFVLRARSQFPMFATADRPLVALASVISHVGD